MSDPQMIVVRTDPMLRAVVDACARRDGVSLSEFTRRALATAACKTIRDTADHEEEELES